MSPGWPGMELHQVFALHLEAALTEVAEEKGVRGPFGWHLVKLNPASQCTQEICEMYQPLLCELIKRDEKLALSELRQVFYDLNVLFGARLSYPGEATRLNWSKMEAKRFLTVVHYTWKAIKRPGTARSDCIKNLRALALIHTSRVNLDTPEGLDFSTNDREDEMKVGMLEISDDEAVMSQIADTDSLVDSLEDLDFEESAKDGPTSKFNVEQKTLNVELEDSELEWKTCHDTDSELEEMDAEPPPGMSDHVAGMCLPDEPSVSDEDSDIVEEAGLPDEPSDADEDADVVEEADPIDSAIAEAEGVPLVDSQDHKAKRVELRKQARNRKGKAKGGKKAKAGMKTKGKAKTKAKVDIAQAVVRRLKGKQPVPLVPPQDPCRIVIMQQRDDTIYQLRLNKIALCQTSANMFGEAAQEYANILKTMFDAGHSKIDLNLKKKEWKASMKASPSRE